MKRSSLDTEYQSLPLILISLPVSEVSGGDVDLSLSLLSLSLSLSLFSLLQKYYHGILYFEDIYRQLSLLCDIPHRIDANYIAYFPDTDR